MSAPSSKYIRWFEDVAMGDIAEVGGKNAALGEMVQKLAVHGVRVPGGFAITTAAYWDLLRENGLDRRLPEILHGLETHDLDDLRSRGRAIRHDILAARLPAGVEQQILAAYAPYDVVMSDMAPNTSGSKFQDQARSTELFLRALEVAVAHGKQGSNFTAKIFMSGDYKAAEMEVRRAYEAVRTIRPEGTRQVSTEVFVVGMGKR